MGVKGAKGLEGVSQRVHKAKENVDEVIAETGTLFFSFLLLLEKCVPRFYIFFVYNIFFWLSFNDFLLCWR